MNDFKKEFKLGRLNFILYKRLQSGDCSCCSKCGCNHYDGPFMDYVSWCYQSETLFFGRWELNIQNRRDPKRMYSK